MVDTNELRYVYVFVLLHFAKREVETILSVASPMFLFRILVLNLSQCSSLLQLDDAFHEHLQKVGSLFIHSF
jgi:hypothetical protein